MSYTFALSLSSVKPLAIRSTWTLIWDVWARWAYAKLHSTSQMNFKKETFIIDSTKYVVSYCWNTVIHKEANIYR